MSKSPKISVLMSVFNAEKSIEKSINSILNQSYENFELLIMDDKSTDNTGQILNSYSSFDERIKIYENMENIGLTKSLNILINKAQGEYLARQDSDDESDIRRFEKQINFIESKQVFIIKHRYFKTINIWIIFFQTIYNFFQVVINYTITSNYISNILFTSINSN